MTAKILTELNIRTYQHTDMEDVIHIWNKCGLIRIWNNPKLDIQRKVKTQNYLFFVAELSNIIIASKRWVCIQGPHNEKHDDGTFITPENPNGELVWTIGDASIKKFFALPIFEKCTTFIGGAPKVWPFGKQFYFDGKLTR